MARKIAPHLNVKLDKDKWETEIIDLVGKIQPTWSKCSLEIKVSFFQIVYEDARKDLSQIIT